jgi:hypothetical protein
MMPMPTSPPFPPIIQMVGTGGAAEILIEGHIFSGREGL